MSFFAKSSRMSFGYCASRSICGARGAIFSCATARIVARRSSNSGGIRYPVDAASRLMLMPPLW